MRGEWAQRVAVEYRSAAVTQHLTLWLIQIGASPDLIREGLRIVDDELVHAELSYRVLVAAGGRPEVVDRDALRLVGTDDVLERDVLRCCVATFCLGETVAVPLFAELRKGCTVAIARRALDRVLRDEVRHRDFGWTLLAWLLERDEALSAIAEAELPAQLEAVRQTYAPDDASMELDDADRAWGLMPTARYRDVLLRSIERDYVPRFARLGIDARRAWRQAQGRLS